MYNLYRYMSDEEVQKAFWRFTINALETFLVAFFG